MYRMFIVYTLSAVYLQEITFIFSLGGSLLKYVYSQLNTCALLLAYVPHQYTTHRNRNATLAHINRRRRRFVDRSCSYSFRSSVKIYCDSI